MKDNVENYQNYGIRMHDIGLCSPAELAERMGVLNLHYGQLAIQKSIPGIESYHDVDDSLLDEIAHCFAQNSINISVLGCYVQLIHPDKVERKAQLDNFEKAIYCAAALNAGCVGTETPPSGTDNKNPKVFNDLCRSVEYMLEKARPMGVTVALEPVRTDVLYSPEATYQLLRRFSGQDIGIIFDAMNMFHPHMVTKQETLWRECLDAFGAQIVVCHIKDGVPDDKGGWSERVLGGGVFKYEKICDGLRRIKRGVPLIREGFVQSEVPIELAYLRKLAAWMQV